MSKRFRFYPSAMLRKKPRPLKTKTRVSDFRDGFYMTTVSVEFTNGTSVSRTFPSVTPFFSAIKVRLELINMEIKRLNENKYLRKIGNSFILR